MNVVYSTVCLCYSYSFNSFELFGFIQIVRD